MIFATTLLKSFILTLTALFIMSATSIDIPDSVIPTSFEKGSYGEFIKSLPQRLPVGEWVSLSRNNIRPWTEFVKSDNFRAPQSFQRLLKRAVNNVNYFKANYLVIAFILLAYSLLTSPMLLLAIMLTVAVGNWLSHRAANTRMIIGSREITLHQQYMLLSLCSVPVFYWAGITALMFWVMGVTCFITSVHAALYNIDVLVNPADQLNVMINQI